MSTKTFVEHCLEGNAFLSDIDDYVSRWHAGSSSESLPEYLGMTDEEYNAWLLDASVLPFIIRARKYGLNFKEIYTNEIEKIAARNSNSRQVRYLLEWLKRHG